MPAKSSRDSVEALLSDLDSLGTDAATAPPRASSATSSTKRTSARAQPSHIRGADDDAQSLLDDLDNLVQRRAATPKRVAELTQGSSHGAASPDSPSPSAPATTGIPETATVPLSAGAGLTRSPSAPIDEGDSVAAQAASKLGAAPLPEQQQQAASQASATASSSGGWNSWGSVWSTASKLADQARAELEKRAQSEQAKELTNRGWGLAQNVRGFVKEAGLEKLGEDLGKAGKRGWTEVLNAVAPPISAHEVIQVTLSHDMVGFDGVEDVTFQVFARVMESQVSRGLEHQLIVNKAPRARQSSDAREAQEGGSQERDMKAMDGYEEAWATAEKALSALIETHEPERPKTNSVTVPVSYCPVFLRVQAVHATLPGSGSFKGTSTSATPSQSSSTSPSSSADQLYVSFLLLLQDPSHGLSHRTCSQCFPVSWLSQSFEQNPWIEQAMVDILDGALGIIGQDYINGRQSGRSRSAEKDEV
ncbi:hypothetical protein BCV69DRAFT_280340 [Microstroma glucosiphilum]|uniref:Maintenance of telomere capping protein 1 n=1 Tax=Pseudomicrostroma glucosiphilum TaxID=1684307 RepID=A0A316UHR8_9BASI|nr:hypothetical protein BCV69DRAFT_280340 [Pseudomicrostroma glucosiphilum]PWN22735.1 hypothetical protein BCV69DRAFT_280340 [Pseudomicrostroma glucosiphilum]